MQMKQNNHKTIAFLILLIFLAGFGTIFYNYKNASDKLQPKNRYIIISPLFLMAVYNNFNNKQLTKDTARAYLHDQQYANKTFVAFQCRVPTETIMTIIGPAPKIWHVPFFPKRYFVRLKPDLSRGLDIILELNRGLDGNLDGLNSELFSKL